MPRCSVCGGHPLQCPICGGKLRVERVVNTSENELYKERKCSSCGHSIYTIEFEVEGDYKVLETFEARERTRKIRYGYYTQEEKDYIREHRFDRVVDIANTLGRSRNSVQKYVYKYRKEVD